MDNISISPKKKAFSKLLQYKYIYLLIAPGIIWYILFSYVPMYGIILAFKKFIYVDGILGSPWVGLKHFRFMFRDPEFLDAIRNTLIISFGKLLFGFPAPLIIALLLNELRIKLYKRFVQSLLYLPHFLSWIIVAGLIYNLLSISSGLVNKIIVDVFHSDPILFLGNEHYFRALIFISDIWKNAGWGTIIFLAAIAGVNPELYEAATIDGANRFKRMLYITLPSIKGAIMILLILNVGNVMNAGFDQILNLYSPGVWAVGDIIDTFVFRHGVLTGQFEYSTAVGLFKSVINMILLLAANWVVRLSGEKGIF